jgi:hypothetical protein
VARQFKVNYTDRRTQVVTADKWESAGSNWIFTLGGREVAVISQKAVESITDDDIPGPAGRAPRTGGI